MSPWGWSSDDPPDSSPKNGGGAEGTPGRGPGGGGRGVVVGRPAGFFAEERRVHEGHLGQVAGGAVLEELVVAPRDRGVLLPPESDEWNVAEVVAPLQSGRGQAVPDRRQGREREGVVD